MKVIDLLNKIANGEEVPKKIKYQDNYYNLIRKYNDIWEEYEFGYQTSTGGYLNIWRDNVLNDEVEILEQEKKIPEKLTPFEAPFLKNEEPDIRFRLIIDRINEICDYLKSKGE